jgi:hypothetical protein
MAYQFDLVRSFTANGDLSLSLRRMNCCFIIALHANQRNPGRCLTPYQQPYQQPYLRPSKCPNTTKGLRQEPGAVVPGLGVPCHDLLRPDTELGRNAVASISPLHKVEHLAVANHTRLVRQRCRAPHGRDCPSGG